MGPMDAKFVDAVERLIGRPLPDVLIETGTGFCETLKFAATRFREVRTVELSRELFEKALAVPLDNVIYWRGDSVEKLPTMIDGLNRPVTFYLDAHWSGGVTAKGSKECPLLDELRVITRREFPDVIICDDLRCFGDSGTVGHVNNPHYKPMTFDWRDVTVEECKTILGSACDSFVLDDRLIFSRRA